MSRPSGAALLVVQHEDDCPVGMIEPWLQQVGLACDVVPAHLGAQLPARLEDHAGLVVLGGQMGAGDDHHAWLPPTRSLIATTVTAGLPFLGVCLGHQMAGLALGGRVARNPHGRSMDLLPFGATEAGLTDELTSALASGAQVLHWNNDVVVGLPPGARTLATAPDGTVQAARFGPAAWGVQFHPEVDADVVARWAHGEEPVREDATLAALRDHRESLHQSWSALITRFGQIITSGTTRPTSAAAASPGGRIAL